jgi:hypothetical protein
MSGIRCRQMRGLDMAIDGPMRAVRSTAISGDPEQEKLTDEQRCVRERILNARPEDDPVPKTERTRALVEFHRANRDVESWQQLLPTERESVAYEERLGLLRRFESAVEVCRAAGISDRDRWAIRPVPAKELAELVRKMNREDAAAPPIQLGAYWICPHCGHQVFQRDATDLGIRDPERKIITCTSNECGEDFPYRKPLEETAWHRDRICLLCLREFSLNKHGWVKQGHTCPACTTKRRDRRKYLRKKALRRG